MNFMFRLEKPLAPGLYKINDQNRAGFEIAKPTDCIKRVIFNDPATIVIWSDDSKTVVKCENETYDPEKGLAMCIAKRAMGNSGNYYNIFKKFLPKKEQESVVYPEAAIANVAQIGTMVMDDDMLKQHEIVMPDNYINRTIHTAMAMGDIKNDLNKAEELYSKALNAIRKYASIDEIEVNKNSEDKEGLET